MEYNLVKVGFTLCILMAVIFSGLINNFEHKLPTSLRWFIRYGKFSYKGESKTTKTFQVPKRFFKHFYLFGSVWATSVLLVATYVYFFSGENLYIVRLLLDALVNYEKKISVSAASAWIALALFTVHLYRRLFETVYVNIFSDSYMNVAYYLISYFHYFACPCIILVEAPGFSLMTSIDHKTAFVLSDIKWTDIGGALVFIWASKHQHSCFVILANLRKNKKGVVEHYKHMVPKGGLFEYVSSPNILFEIIIYLSLAVILWGNTTWPYVVVWVISNQVECALLSHWWYITEFNDYPKNRYAVIPYIL